MHKSVRARRITGTGGKDKSVVLGIRQRGGEVRAGVVPNARRSTLQGPITSTSRPVPRSIPPTTSAATPASTPPTTTRRSTTLSGVDGRAHTNGLENFWSLLQRGLNGTYVSVEPFHLFRYLDERLFAYNLRELGDFDRFAAVLRAAVGRRLTYGELTGHA